MVALETQRLLLRPFVMEDSAAAFDNWTSDEQVVRYLRWPAHADEDVTRRVLRTWVDGYADPAFYQWAIVLKELGQPVGSISVVEMDEGLQKVHIGYCLGSRWWRCGYMTEAFSAVIRFFFDEVGAQRIESMHDPANPNSGSVMRKCGLRYEGTLRQADRNNQGVVDACIYGLLREEYLAAKAGGAVYQKLVRDHIPDLIRKHGELPVTRVLQPHEYLQALQSKLQEEVAEYRQDETAEELADILEVVYALAAAHGLSPEQLQALRQQKRRERGGFDDRIFLIRKERA